MNARGASSARPAWLLTRAAPRRGAIGISVHDREADVSGSAADGARVTSGQHDGFLSTRRAGLPGRRNRPQGVKKATGSSGGERSQPRHKSTPRTVPDGMMPMRRPGGIQVGCAETGCVRGGTRRSRFRRLIRASSSPGATRLAMRPRVRRRTRRARRASSMRVRVDRRSAAGGSRAPESSRSS